MNDTDEKLYSRYLEDGDEDALRLLLMRYREPLTLFVNEYVHNVDDAEELMLDAFAVVAAKTSRFGGKSSFKTWLYAIARNLAADRLRKNRFKTEELTEVEADVRSAAPDYEILQKERNRQIYEALENIPKDYRQVLFLIYFEQLTEEEAAKVMKKSKKQIYHLVSRGREALRKELERRGIENAKC